MATQAFACLDYGKLLAFGDNYLTDFFFFFFLGMVVMREVPIKNPIYLMLVDPLVRQQKELGSRLLNLLSLFVNQ